MLFSGRSWQLDIERDVGFLPQPVTCLSVISLLRFVNKYAELHALFQASCRPYIPALLISRDAEKLDELTKKWKQMVRGPHYHKKDGKLDRKSVLAYRWNLLININDMPQDQQVC